MQVSKQLKADEGTYAFLQQMAATGVPQSPSWTQQPSANSSPAQKPHSAQPADPIIPARLAGAGLTAFAAKI